MSALCGDAGFAQKVLWWNGDRGASARSVLKRVHDSDNSRGRSERPGIEEALMSSTGSESSTVNVRNDADIDLILRSIEHALQHRSPVDQQRVRQVISQALGDGGLFRYSSDLTIEGLYVWDLLSRATYFDIQFALNEDQAACHLPWEERSAELIERLMDDTDGIIAAWNASRMIELAFALEQAGCRSDRVSDWCRAVFDRSKGSGAQRRRAADAFARRSALSEQKLSIWRLRKMDRLSLAGIGEQLEISDYSVRIGISEGGELQARRVAIANPVVKRGA